MTELKRLKLDIESETGTRFGLTWHYLVELVLLPSRYPNSFHFSDDSDSLRVLSISVSLLLALIRCTGCLLATTTHRTLRGRVKWHHWRRGTIKFMNRRVTFGRLIQSLERKQTGTFIKDTKRLLTLFHDFNRCPNANGNRILCLRNWVFQVC